MISVEDIRYFFNEYKRNLDEEAKLTRSILGVESINLIIEVMQKRKEGIRLLREKNIDLLNKYFYPILENEDNLSEELIDTLLNETHEYCINGYTDYVGGLQLLELIERFYDKNYGPDEKKDRRIVLYHIMGYLYNKTIGVDEILLYSMKYYEKCANYAKDYFSYESSKIRKTMIISAQNYCIQLLNYTNAIVTGEKKDMFEHQRKLAECAKRIIPFYENEKIREFEKDNIDFDDRVRKVKTVLFSSTLIEMTRYDAVDPEYFELAQKNLKELYEYELSQNNNDVRKVNDDILVNYIMSKYIKQEITLDDFVDELFDVIKSVLENEEKVKGKEFYHSTFFTVCATKIPFILMFIENNDIQSEKREEILTYCIEKYLEMMEWIPYCETNMSASTDIEKSARDIVNFLPPHIVKYNFILKSIINRDELCMLHSIMARHITGIVLKVILEEKPELLIGTFNTQNIMDVLRMQDEIVDYVRKASQIYDIGMTRLPDITQKETRYLSEYELERIKKHPIVGCYLLKDIDVMQGFNDVIMGHHKDYDGKGGYPEDYDNTKSNVRFITDLIRICDCMEAATDNIGRNYKKALSFEAFLSELQEGAGTKYNPHIVELILDNSQLQSELKKCCITNRERVYYETYYEYIGNASDIVKENDEKKDSLPVWTKSAIRVMEIDFYRDTLRTVYVGSVSAKDKIPDGQFSRYAESGLENYIHPDDFVVLKRLFDYGTLADKLNINHGSFELELRFRKNDVWRWIRLQFLVSVEHFGIPQKIIIIVTDADEQCRKRQKMTEALEQAREEAKAANKAKSLFLSNISHEIRTPMNAIVGMVEILLRSNLDDSQKGYLMNIKNSGNALLAIINDILDFSKMESGKFEIIESEYDLMALLSEISMIFLNRIDEKPVELIYDIDKNIPKVLYGDSLRFRQVIINLMNNAIKFTDSGVVSLKIFVNEVVDDEIELKVVVKDSGIGIKQEDISKLFGQFQQIDVKKNYEKEGTGLGLVISKQLIELMGGSISVSSVYGEGSEFSFTVKQRIVDSKASATINGEVISDDFIVGCLFESKLMADVIENLCKEFELGFCNLAIQVDKVDVVFTDTRSVNRVTPIVGADTKICVLQNPMLESVDVDGVRVTNKPLYSIGFCRVVNNEEEQHRNLTSESALNFVAPKANILIVDDTPMNITVAKGLLQPLKMQIDTANSGMQAIEMIQNKKYDLIFMDHKMPGMDGIDTTVCIRTMEDEYYKTVPIIALTANAVLEARNSFFEAGMNDFVAKPIDINDITQKIKKWLPPEYIEKASNEDLIQQKEVASSRIEIEGINVEEGLKNSGGFELFATLICDYYKLIDSKASKIRNLLAEGMIKEYTVEVHAMKSVSRVIGALELSDQFKELEALGDKGEIEILYEKTPVVLEHYIAYKGFLKSFVLERESLKEKNSISNDELLEILEIMSVAMQSCDLDMVDECMNKLDNSDILDVLSEQMEKLSMLVADVNMEESIQVMTEMSEKLKRM